MQTVRGREELAQALAVLKGRGRVALVPTMGALHAGHVALIEEAKRRADHVVATIFVNPLQFGPAEDLGRYPRREAEDAEALEQAGCDLLWLPAAHDIYPEGFATSITVSGVSDRWEAEARPTHFTGVATVVAKLLMSVQPDVALFGEKDFQQLAVIRRMVTDLDVPIEIIGVETVRDEDGLALSSRNSYLTEDERRRAVALPHALQKARSAILTGQQVGAVIAGAREDLLSSGFSRIDYVALVDGTTLEPLQQPSSGARLIAAAVIGTTRLIDNLEL